MVCKYSIFCPEIGRVAAGRESDINMQWAAWTGLLLLSSVWLLQVC